MKEILSLDRSNILSSLSGKVFPSRSIEYEMHGTGVPWHTILNFCYKKICQ